MRIQTNAAANSAFRNLTNTNDMLSASVQKLSSGFRINRSADDVAGQAVANALRSEGRALGAAQRNATQANAVLSVADGALGQISQIVDRMRELAVQAGSANSSTADRLNLNTEFTGLVAEVNRIVSETTYQGVSLLDGSFTGQEFRVGTGAGAIITASIVTGNASGLGIDTLSITAAGVTAALDALSAAGTAMTRINTMAGVIGAAQNRLGFAITTLSARVENVRAAESVVRDLNVAEEMTNFSRLQILQQAGTAMLQQANSAPQSVLSLLRG